MKRVFRLGKSAGFVEVWDSKGSGFDAQSRPLSVHRTDAERTRERKSNSIDVGAWNEVGSFPAKRVN